MNKFDATWQRQMMIALKSKTNMPNGSYFQPLFDPVQTHALYGLTEATLPSAKEELSKLGANRFRVVAVSKNGFRILCFSAKKIALGTSV